MKITTIGLDLAKNVFHVVCFDERLKERGKRMLKRHQVLKYFANMPPCCVAINEKEKGVGSHLNYQLFDFNN